MLGAAAEQSSRYVTAREYYCFKLQIRRGIFNILLFGGRLFQQWAVNMYIKIESMRLDWYSNPDNQKLIRAELYQVTNHVLLFINIFITLATFELHKAKIKCQNLLL